MAGQVLFLHQQFLDFEAFCENIYKWDLDYRQLDRGDFFSELLMFGNATTLFTRKKQGRRMLQRGTAPVGLVRILLDLCNGLSI